MTSYSNFAKPVNPGTPDHGVFDTYFNTYPFKFNSSNQIGEYNTQDNPGQFSDYLPGTGLYYAAFNFDTTNLSGDVTMHFDLYKDNNVFAPFSHDAQSDLLLGESPNPRPCCSSAPVSLASA